MARTKKEQNENIVDVKDADILKGFYGLTPETFIYWTPDIIREKIKDKSKWPVFKIRPISAQDQAEILDFYNFNLNSFERKKLSDEIDNIIESKNYNRQTVELARNLVKRNLTDWKNFRDSNNKEILIQKDEDGKISDDSIDTLPYPLLVALLTVISRSNELLDSEKMGLEF